jgi:hypothetical protein
LARVAEENPQPVRVNTNLDSKATAPTENLISMDTPRPSDELSQPRNSLGSDKENTESKDTKDTKRISSSLKSPTAAAEPEGLKTVEI